MTTATVTCPSCCEQPTFVDRILTGNPQGNYLEGECEAGCCWRQYEAGGSWDEFQRLGADGDEWETVEADEE